MGIMDKVKDVLPGLHNQQQGGDYARTGGDDYNRPGNDNFNNPAYSGNNSNNVGGAGYESSPRSETSAFDSPKDSFSQGTFDDPTQMRSGTGAGAGTGSFMPTGSSTYSEDTDRMNRGFGSDDRDNLSGGQQGMGGLDGADRYGAAQGERMGMGMTQDMGSGMMGGAGDRGDMTGDEYTTATGNRNASGYGGQAQGYGQSQSDY
ncbi:hypothetical protein IAT40_006003 [Kwoniella sp. CBS 6097]